jgi:3-oxoacyl-[acyl-carrier-protein] synthase II
MSEYSNRRVVVTGIGTVNPLGLSVDEFWNSMMEGKSGCDFIKAFDTSRVKTKFACELKGFDSSNFMDKKSARRLDAYAQYAMASTVQAINDSGIKTDSLSEYEKSRIGVIFGSGIGGIHTFY